LLHNKLNLGAIFDTVGRKASSTFFSVERYLDLISVKAEKAEIFATFRFAIPFEGHIIQETLT